jgi:hypothetical protein
MLTDEFAEKVADLILEKLKGSKLIKEPPVPRAWKLCKAEKKMLHSLELALKECHGGAQEWRWRDVHAETYNLSRGYLRMQFFRYRDELVNRGYVIFDGVGYSLPVTSGVSESVSNVSNVSFQ